MTAVTFDPTRPQFADVSHHRPVVDFAAHAGATGAAALGATTWATAWSTGVR